MGLKSLLYSTNFWNAIIGSGSAIAVYYFTQSESITLAILGVFGLRTLAKGWQDYGQARSLGGTNPPKKKDEK